MKSLGQRIIAAVIKARAVNRAIVEDGAATILVWSANAEEQLEAAFKSLQTEDGPVCPKCGWDENVVKPWVNPERGSHFCDACCHYFTPQSPDPEQLKEERNDWMRAAKQNQFHFVEERKEKDQLRADLGAARKKLEEGVHIVAEFCQRFQKIRELAGARVSPARL